jgi:hypothetical protein
VKIKLNDKIKADEFQAYGVRQRALPVKKIIRRVQASDKKSSLLPSRALLTPIRLTIARVYIILPTRGTAICRSQMDI